MEQAIKLIKESINKKPFEKEIKVYGWKNNFDHKLIQSVSSYLFEDFNVIENLASINNENRPGNIKPKYYITVHDTGDADPIHTAQFWSNTVRDEYWEQGKYACSYQYVVGNDGTYQQIPDNEVAWHAGDTTKFDYKLYKTNVTGQNPKPCITISDDGYFEIDKVKSNILAPRIYKEEDGKTVLDRIPLTKDINDQSILCKLIDGVYYLGEVYFNETYELIANRGGNNNSIGIESCVNEGSDIYYTWQKTAKLVANLLYKYGLSFDDVRQHHYYSGKNCPETMRENKMWDHFMSLVKIEYAFCKLLVEGFKFKLIPLSDNVTEQGRISNFNQPIKFNIEVTKDNKSEILEFSL